jgi:hypothetical protein
VGRLLRDRRRNGAIQRGPAAGRNGESEEMTGHPLMFGFLRTERGMSEAGTLSDAPLVQTGECRDVCFSAEELGDNLGLNAENLENLRRSGRFLSMDLGTGRNVITYPPSSSICMPIMAIRNELNRQPEEDCRAPAVACVGKLATHWQQRLTRDGSLLYKKAGPAHHTNADPAGH